MASILQTTFSIAFSCMTVVVFWFKFYLNLSSRVQLAILSALVHKVPWRRTGVKPFSKPMIAQFTIYIYVCVCVCIYIYICVTRIQWVNKSSIYLWSIPRSKYSCARGIVQQSSILLTMTEVNIWISDHRAELSHWAREDNLISQHLLKNWAAPETGLCDSFSYLT